MRKLTNFFKSKTDKRLYRYLELNNSLRCLLISDPETEHSAASLDVNVGSMHDPLEYPGLAHFCEHMLFLGTKKYPNENDYGNYIKMHGGEKNAFTGALDTNYYFSVGNKSLDGALDRFSQFFKQPLFNESSVDREIHAVDSEHKKNLQNDHRRLDQILLSHANPLSRINRFSTGSSETLRKDGIRNQLLDFYDKNYSANLMTLTILGNHPLDYLESLAIEHFTGIEEKKVAPEDFSQPVPFDPSRLGKLYKYVPINSRHILKMNWLIPDTRQFYKSKPASYLSFLMGHEGPNSLLSYLLDEELALSLSSSVSDEEANTSFLTSSIELTDKGLKDYERVVEIVSAYANLMKEKGPQKYIFDENARMSKLRFDYKSQTDPLDAVSDLAYIMHRYKGDTVKDLLSGPYVVEEYEPERIKALLDRLRPENMLVVLSSQTCVPDANLEEKWYKSKYSMQDLPSNTIKHLQTATVRASKNGKVLDLPPSNNLLPKNVSLLNVPSNPPVIPRLLKETERGTIWYKQDHKFAVPKAYGFCQIATKDHSLPVSYEASMAWKYKVKLFFEEMREFMYMTELAGVDCDLGFSGGMLHMNFYGFNDSLPQTVDQFLKKFREFKPEKYQKLFELKKAQNIRGIKSSLYSTPYRIALNNWGVGLCAYGNSQFDRLCLLEKFTFDKFLHHSKDWLDSTRFEWYIAGNIPDSLAASTAENAENLLAAKPLSKDLVIRNRTVQIPSKTEYAFTKKLPNEAEVNSCIISYFQGEPYVDAELEKWCLNDLAFEVIKEPAFDTLRTKMQLGYVVGSNPYNLHKVLGGKFLIQSNKAPPEVLYQKINTFLDEIRLKVKNMTEGEFKQHVESVSIPLRQKPISLAEESVVYWKEISHNEYLFDRDNKLLETLGRLKKEQLVEYFEQLFFTNVKRYDYQLVCNAHLEENEKMKCKNKETARAKGNKRIEVVSETQMRELNYLYPDIYLHNLTHAHHQLSIYSLITSY
eukprot:TRINITY_DN135276_c2_g1_i1.p1 TRINITY_DN135276_c2_g1~~TRINITY_DN135276_c2_g1_i1.p1  ORF type:complete len:1115 (-),score=53.18 TRINITY_DN135276_c2_g1_i1:2733-5687(-)